MHQPIHDDDPPFTGGVPPEVPPPPPDPSSLDQRWKQFQSAFDRILRASLGFDIDFDLDPVPPEERQSVLDGDVSLDGIARKIKEGACKKIVVLSGAGISVSAGIPDFRTPGTGLYDNLQKYNLPYPQAIFEMGFFRENPKPFFTLAKELWPGNFKPTIAHYFVKLLANKGLLLRNYTQNIDTLERCAGIDEELLVEAHGSFASSRCTQCSADVDSAFVQERIMADDVPLCEACGGVVKPNIVFFGESLPQRFGALHKDDLPACDLLIVMGTSLKVQPFAGLISKCGLKVPRLLINREEVGKFMAGGFEFGSEENYRDVPLLTDCDSGVQELCEKLGWKEELVALAAEAGHVLPAFAVATPHRAPEERPKEAAAAAPPPKGEELEGGCSTADYTESLASRELERAVSEAIDAPPSPRHEPGEL